MNIFYCFFFFLPQMLFLSFNQKPMVIGTSATILTHFVLGFSTTTLCWLLVNMEASLSANQSRSS